MNVRQWPLKLNRLLTAVVILAGGIVIAFSTANGNGASTASDDPSVTAPAPKTSETETENVKVGTPDSNVPVPSGNAAHQEKTDEASVPVRPERTMTIGIRKIYAPESEAQRWPLGNKKYTFINAQKFESNYKLWKELLSDGSTESNPVPMSSEVCIESARYYGSVSDSGDLSGWGEWKIVVNRQMQDVQAGSDSSKTSNSNNGSGSVSEKILAAAGLENQRIELFLSSELKILLTDFVFYDASVTNIPEPKNEPNSDESSPLQADSETRYPVEKDVVSASFPNGQTVLFIPSEGTVRFRWKAKRQDVNDYQIQSFDSVETLWTIDVPANEKLTLRLDGLDEESKSLCASVTKEKIGKSNSWRYFIRWTESETAIVHIGLEDENENRFDRFYQQQTTYTLTPYHLNTQCRVTYEPDSRSGIPQEIPFTVVHDPRVIWEATFDGQPADIQITETGYSVSLKKCKTDNPRPELIITSNCPLGEVKNESRDSKRENESAPSRFSTLSLPRIEFQSGRWQNGTAVIYTLQPPTSIDTDKCSVVDSKRVAARRFQTIIEQAAPDANVVLEIEPLKERFYSQTQTVVQWDGSQASFNSTIELQAEEGRLYSLTASLPEGLTIDQASSEEQPEQIEDWEINSAPDNPAKRTLTIYLRKSLSPGRSLVLNIRSHAIADWSKPIELNRLAPIVFDRFESHTQILYVNVALNQRFIVGERILYSPEQEDLSEEHSDDLASELPYGIDCTPHSSPVNGTGTGRLDAYEFCIDLKMWGNCLASLEPVQSDFVVNAKTTIWVDKNSMEEKIELAFTGERSHLSQFRFSYGCPSDASTAWEGMLVWPDNRYKVKVEPVEGNVFSIEIPRNVSSSFTVYLSRRIDWNEKRDFEVLGSNDCSRLTTSVSILSRMPQLFNVHTQGMKFVKSVSDDNADFTIGAYEYELKNKKRDSAKDSPAAQSDSDGSLPPRIDISACSAPASDVSIWAWSQVVEERHFGSGDVLTSAQWTIENRYPAQDFTQSPDSSNTRLKITLPTDLTDGSRSGVPPFLTGVRIDNESVSGENIIQESEYSYFIILPPKKKYFVLTVQWASFDKTLKTCSSFRPQKPILDITVLQTNWELYYPTSYRRLNSFMASDPTVDGWLERFFGSLLRSDSVSVMNIVSHIWDAEQNSESKNEGLETGAVLSPSTRIKTDSNSIFPAVYTLPDNVPWSCCRFDGSGAPKIIRIVRREVSECIRWMFFIITVTVILSLYFKRSDMLQVQNTKSETGKVEKKGFASWGFRRWICVFGAACCVLCQALPWFLSLFFSGAFLGVLVCLIVLAVPINAEKTDVVEDPNQAARSSYSVHKNSRLSVQTLRIFIFAAVTMTQASFGQEPVLPPPSARFIAPGTVENREYEIFIPVDRQNHPKSGYYVPQELLDLMQTRESRSLERSWIVCRTQYYGKLIQKPRQTESGLWKCAIEIETLTPNTAIDLPVQIRETISVTSNISVSRGRIINSSVSKEKDAGSDDSKSEAQYWSWDKLDIQTVLQWNVKNERWGIRLAQPGRYLIEAEFRPTIVAVNGKNEISFPILECVNSTFELLAPENIKGLEFPGAFGGVTELSSNLEMPDPSFPVQPGLKLKRVQLGAAKQLTVRWNAGGFLSDGSLYDVDTITWWNVMPDSVDVKIKYILKVVSGSVSSIEISTDERLALLSESTADNQETQNATDSSEKKDEKLQGDSPDSESKEEDNKEQNLTPPARNSLLKTNSAISQSGVHYTVISNPDKPGVITVKFDSPITSQTSFELHYIWKDAVGVGRLQFPATSVESSRSGQRTLAFTFDSRLQYECVSESLIPLSVQSFWEQWRGFQKQSVSSSDNDKVTTDRGTVRSPAEPIPGNYTEKDSSGKQIPLPPPPPQNLANLPTVAYDLNLSRRKTDASGVVDSVIMNVQRTKASSEGTTEAFVLVDWNRLLWQIKWTINITRGERSGYTAVLPEFMCKPENRLSIISASVSVFDNNQGRMYSVNSSIEGNELKLYWGTPIEGKCLLTVTGEMFPDFKDEKPDSLRKIDFDFPEIKTLNVTQYKLAIGRTDDCIIKTIFNKPAPKTVVWTQAELSVESPFSSRNQRLMETWQTTINDTSKRPCAFSVEIQKNNLDAEIDAVVKPVPENASSLAVSGRIKVNQGILDEFLLDVPENCFAPISSKTTLKCELDALSISQRRYILRPLSPFTSDSELELTIPLKKAEPCSWKLEKKDSLQWSVVRVDNLSQTDEQTTEQKTDAAAPSAETSKPSLDKSGSSESVTKIFGLKMYVKPISESEYCAAAEFACAVLGTDKVLVRLPKGSKTLNVQIDRRSVRWIEKEAGETLVPMMTENDPVDVRIVYTAPLNRTLYTDPMKFEPPTIEQAQQPDIIWMVMPWKNLYHLDPNVVRATSFINKQIWLINDLNNQFQYLQQTTENSSPLALVRLSRKLDEIEMQLNQYETRGEKPKAKINSGSLIPRPEAIARPKLTATETGAIRLAMQNVLRLRGSINEKMLKIEKQKNSGKKQETNDYFSLLVNNSEADSQAAAPQALVGTSDPGVAFVLVYALPPSVAPTASIWQILSLLIIPVVFWLTFFPPESFIVWRPAFVFGCLSIIWLLFFNTSCIAILLIIVALVDAINKLRLRFKRNAVPLKVR